MLWLRKMRVRADRHDFWYGLANALCGLGVGCLILGVALWAPLGWAGLVLLISGLAVLAWSDSYLPAKKERKEEYESH